MRTFSRFLIGAAGVAAIAGAAYAADRNIHVLKVMLPDGSVEQIHYTGKVAPQVVSSAQQVAVPVAFADPFAEMDRAFAEMDARADAMLQQAAQCRPRRRGRVASSTWRRFSRSHPVRRATGITSYSSSDGKSCSQSVQVTAYEPGKAPKVVRQDSGDCTAMNTRQATPAVQQTVPAPLPSPIPAAYHPKGTAKTDDPSI